MGACVALKYTFLPCQARLGRFLRPVAQTTNKVLKNVLCVADVVEQRLE